MLMLYELIPVLLFFITFKLYNIYAATLVGIIATSAQALLTRVYTKRWDRKQLITLAVFLIFGSLTLYFHNPIFVKWKPTIVFWIFALMIIISHFFMAKPLMQRLMEGVLEEKGVVPGLVWKKLNIIWALFFISLGFINLYIAYTFSNEAWVNFKFYGIMGALFVFSLFQTVCLMRYIQPK